MDDIEETARRNQQRITFGYRKQLIQLGRIHVTEGMTNGNRAAVLRNFGSLVKEKPSDGKEKDDEGPLIDEKYALYGP